MIIVPPYHGLIEILCTSHRPVIRHELKSTSVLCDICRPFLAGIWIDNVIEDHGLNVCWKSEKWEWLLGVADSNEVFVAVADPDYADGLTHTTADHSLHISIFEY